MIIEQNDGIHNMNLEITDVPDMLVGLGTLLFMATSSSISMEDSTLRVIDYLLNGIATDIEKDLKRRGIQE